MRLVMRAAIERLQTGFLSAEAISASHAVMGLDTQLVIDGTYFVASVGPAVAGCGGWSLRATLYGGDRSSVLREPRRLDAQREPARIRAMYTHPDFARRGIGSRILQLSETAARQAGFKTVELMATLAGEPLYRWAGYSVLERTADDVDGVLVPLVRMGKPLYR